VIAPLPFVVANDDGVAGDDATSIAVLGFHETTCVPSAIVKETSFVPDRSVEVDAAVARTVHVPTAVKVMTAVDELMLQPVVPALTKE
jgi:hypothetical protein